MKIRNPHLALTEAVPRDSGEQAENRSEALLIWGDFPRMCASCAGAADPVWMTTSNACLDPRTLF